MIMVRVESLTACYPILFWLDRKTLYVGYTQDSKSGMERYRSGKPSHRKEPQKRGFPVLRVKIHYSDGILRSVGDKKTLAIG